MHDGDISISRGAGGVQEVPPSLIVGPVSRFLSPFGEPVTAPGDFDDDEGGHGVSAGAEPAGGGALVAFGSLWESCCGKSPSLEVKSHSQLGRVLPVVVEVLHKRECLSTKVFVCCANVSHVDITPA